jgi:hypothetical protein
VVIMFNGLNLQVLFVFVFMKVVFFKKKSEKVDKNYPILLTKDIQGG